MNYIVSVIYKNSCWTDAVSDKEVLHREHWKPKEDILSFLKNRTA